MSSHSQEFYTSCSASSLSSSITNNINDDQLISLSVRELNRQLKSSKISKYQMQQMKQRRRTLKNRGYAASCRNKRCQKKGELEIIKRDELRQIECLENEISRYKDLIAQLSNKISDCQMFARQNNVNIDSNPFSQQNYQSQMNN